MGNRGILATCLLSCQPFEQAPGPQHTAVLNAAFHTTVAQLRELPADSLAEVAFAGRSNAGKSSAINTLCNHKRLAFVSKMPGRTQHLNFFRVEASRYLVDLPGYRAGHRALVVDSGRQPDRV